MLEERRAALEDLGATLVAFSPQTVTHNLKSVRDYGLGFNLLSDAGNALADRLGIAYRVGESLIKAVIASAASDGPNTTAPLLANAAVGAVCHRYRRQDRDGTGEPRLRGRPESTTTLATIVSLNVPGNG